MVILPGPVKVDIIIDLPHEPGPGIQRGRIDASAHREPLLGLVAVAHEQASEGKAWPRCRRARGRSTATSSCRCVALVPRDLGDAVDLYDAARDEQEARFRVRLDRRLASEIEAVVRRVLDDA